MNISGGTSKLARCVLLPSLASTLYFLGSSFALATTCLVPPSGMVGWWRGEGEAGDMVGGLDGTLHGGLGFAGGIVGQAFKFDGVNDVMTTTMGALSNVVDTYTMEFWAWPDAARAVTPESTSGTAGAGNQRYAIYPKMGSLTPPKGFVGSGVSVGTNGVSVVEHDGVYLPTLLVHNAPINGWTHVAVVYVNRQPRLYLNGELVRTGLTSSRSSSPSTWLGESAPATGNYGYYSGLLDEVSIYNQALSAAELQAIYQAGSAGKCVSYEAPVIVSQPASKTVVAGTDATLSVVATGTPPLSYQWFLNSTNLVGATNASLLLSNVQSSDSGLYHGVVSNGGGATTSSNALLTVVTSPTCLVPPSGMVGWWRGEGEAGDMVGGLDGTLHGGLGFAGGIVGQAFRFDGVNDVMTTSLGAISNVVDTYTMEFWAWPDAGRAVTVESASGTAGAGNQRYAIYPKMGSLTPPQGFVGSGVSVGTNGVSVVEHDGVYLPTLLVHNAPINGWTHVAVVYVNRQPRLYLNGVLVHTGLTSARSSSPSTWMGESAPASGNYGYYSGLLDEVSIYNRGLSTAELQAIYQAGSAGKCDTNPPPPAPPTIVTQPQDQTVDQGETALFTVEADGSGPFRYIWIHNGNGILEQTNASLVLSNVQPAQAGSYSVLVSNSFGGTLSSNALLTVVISPPTNCTLPGGIVSWWKAEGTGEDSVGSNEGTLLNGVSFTNGMVGQAFNFDGVDDNVRIAASPSLDLGSGDGMTIELWVNPQDVNGGDALIEWSRNPGVFPYGVSMWVGHPWQAPGVFLANLVDTAGGHNVIWSPLGVVAQGQWQHLAVTYDKTSGLARLFLNGAVVSEQNLGIFTPQTTYDVYLGQRPGENWMFAGQMDEVSLYNRALSTNELAAIYQAGSAGKCATNPPPPAPPTIVTQPQYQTVDQGETALFMVEADGSGPFRYIWIHNGSGILGQSNASLVLSNVQPAQAGSYSVLVSNSFGGTLSSNALLTVVTPPPTNCTLPEGIVSWWQAEGTGEDSVGSNEGTLLNGVSFTNGIVGQAFNFDGVDDNVRIAASPSLDLGSGDGMTIELWVNPQDVNGGDALIEWSQNPGVFPYGVSMWVGHPWQAPGVFLANLVDTGGGHNVIWSPLGVVAADQWQHLAVTYDKTTGLARLFLNGAVVSEQNLGIFTPQTTYDVYLGRRPGENWMFAGEMDEVSLYNRALSTNELAAIYQAGSAGKCAPEPPPANLLANGGFELPSGIASYQTFGVGNGIPGWTVERGSVDLVSDSYWRTAEGRQSLDLNGGSAGTIYQDLTTTPGQWYRVRFAYAGNPETGNPPIKSAKVFWNGRELEELTFDVTGQSFTNIGWTYIEYVVSATETTSRLRFLSTSASFYGLTLDDVSVSAAGTPPAGIAPTIVTHPQGGKVNEGSDLLLGVTAEGTPVLVYQWLKDSSPLPDATNSSLSLSPILFADAGTYAVVVSNQFGVAVSSNAVLEVNRFPIADASATVPLVISPNNSNATVVLDGTLSSDPDGDWLSYTWLLDGSEDVLASGVVAVVSLPVGTHLINLTVDDGMASDTDTITVEVITLSQAVEKLVEAVSDSGAGNGQSLIASLRVALASIDRSNPIPAINQLQAFQSKVLTQVAPEDPGLAAEFIQQAQEIIDSLADGDLGPKNLKALANQDPGKVGVEFSGFAGKQYIIEASSDMVTWEMIGVAKHKGNGRFDFEDPDPARLPCRFYRVTEP